VKKDKKYQLIQKIKTFLELYQSYQIRDYDYWDQKNGPTFALFVDKFENESQSLELRASSMILGISVKEEGK